ncbi:bifunctional riboflavin kinase/FAD synthetase [Rhodovibrionaceae bacterium A322]
MQVFRHHTQIPDTARGAVVAIGNFDGIHRGHQQVIGQAASLARDLNAPLAVMTFEPHPRLFFQPDQPPFRLTSFRVKTRLLESLGVDLLFNLAFNAELAGLSAEDFITEVLVKNLGASHVVVGDNFRFGNRRKGDIALLKDLGGKLGLGVTALTRVTSPGDEPYSSSLVRDYLTDGNPTRAGLLLGRYWEIEGRVQPGAKRGRELGFPTANMSLGDSLRPAFGVYAVRAALEEEDGSSRQWIPGVANLGISPMFSYEEPLLETFLFDFDRDIYGRHLRVALVDYLRPEANFKSLEELIEQIEKDCDKAKATLSWEVWDQEWPISPFISDGS